MPITDEQDYLVQSMPYEPSDEEAERRAAQKEKEQARAMEARERRIKDKAKAEALHTQYALPDPKAEDLNAGFKIAVAAAERARAKGMNDEDAALEGIKAQKKAGFLGVEPSDFLLHAIEVEGTNDDGPWEEMARSFSRGSIDISDTDADIQFAQKLQTYSVDAGVNFLAADGGYTADEITGWLGKASRIDVEVVPEEEREKVESEHLREQSKVDSVQMLKDAWGYFADFPTIGVDEDGKFVPDDPALEWATKQIDAMGVDSAVLDYLFVGLDVAGDLAEIVTPGISAEKAQQVYGGFLGAVENVYNLPQVWEDTKRAMSGDMTARKAFYKAVRQIDEGSITDIHPAMQALHERSRRGGAGGSWTAIKEDVLNLPPHAMPTTALTVAAARSRGADNIPEVVGESLMNAMEAAASSHLQKKMSSVLPAGVPTDKKWGDMTDKEKTRYVLDYLPWTARPMAEAIVEAPWFIRETAHGLRDLMGEAAGDWFRSPGWTQFFVPEEHEITEEEAKVRAARRWEIIGLASMPSMVLVEYENKGLDAAMDWVGGLSWQDSGGLVGNYFEDFKRPDLQAALAVLATDPESISEDFAAHVSNNAPDEVLQGWLDAQPMISLPSEVIKLPSEKQVEKGLKRLLADRKKYGITGLTAALTTLQDLSEEPVYHAGRKYKRESTAGWMMRVPFGAAPELIAEADFADFSVDMIRPAAEFAYKWSPSRAMVSRLVDLPGVEEFGDLSELIVRSAWTWAPTIPHLEGAFYSWKEHFGFTYDQARPRDPRYGRRFLSNLGVGGEAGMMMHFMRLSEGMGHEAGSFQNLLAILAGGTLDVLFPWEEMIALPGTRAYRSAKTYSAVGQVRPELGRLQKAKYAVAPGLAAKATRDSLTRSVLAGVQQAEDPMGRAGADLAATAVAANAAAMFYEALATGRGGEDFGDLFEGLDSSTRGAVMGMLELAGINMKELRSGLDEAGKAYRGSFIQYLSDAKNNSDPDTKALRESEPYQRFKAQVQALFDKGRLQGGKEFGLHPVDVVMALVELRALRWADSGDVEGAVRGVSEVRNEARAVEMEAVAAADRGDNAEAEALRERALALHDEANALEQEGVTPLVQEDVERQVAARNPADWFDQIALVFDQTLEEFEATRASKEVKPGATVQWTSQGVDVFPTPKRVTNVEAAPDGTMYGFVEGETTGFPLSELHVVDASGKTAPKERVLWAGGRGRTRVPTQTISWVDTGKDGRRLSAQDNRGATLALVTLRPSGKWNAWFGRENFEGIDFDTREEAIAAVEQRFSAERPEATKGPKGMAQAHQELQDIDAKRRELQREYQRQADLHQIDRPERHAASQAVTEAEGLLDEAKKQLAGVESEIAELLEKGDEASQRRAQRLERRRDQYEGDVASRLNRLAEIKAQEGGPVGQADLPVSVRRMVAEVEALNELYNQLETDVRVNQKYTGDTRFKVRDFYKRYGGRGRNVLRMSLPDRARGWDQFEGGARVEQDPALQELLGRTKGGRPTTIGPVLRHIAENSTDPANKAVAVRLREAYGLDFADDVKFDEDGFPVDGGPFPEKPDTQQGRVRITIGDVEEGALAQYDMRTGLITLSEDGVAEVPILHEVIHALTARKIRAVLQKADGVAASTVKAVEDLESLRAQVMSEIQARVDAGDGSVSKWLDHPSTVRSAEFITYGMSDPEFQAILKSVDAGEAKTLWTRFVELVADVLGFSRSDVTALGRLMELSEQIIEAPDIPYDRARGGIPFNFMAREEVARVLEDVHGEVDGDVDLIAGMDVDLDDIAPAFRFKEDPVLTEESLRDAIFEIAEKYGIDIENPPEGMRVIHQVDEDGTSGYAIDYSERGRTWGTPWEAILLERWQPSRGRMDEWGDRDYALYAMVKLWEMSHNIDLAREVLNHNVFVNPWFDPSVPTKHATIIAEALGAEIVPLEPDVDLVDTARTQQRERVRTDASVDFAEREPALFDALEATEAARPLKDQGRQDAVAVQMIEAGVPLDLLLQRIVDVETDGYLRRLAGELMDAEGGIEGPAPMVMKWETSDPAATPLAVFDPETNIIRLNDYAGFSGQHGYSTAAILHEVIHAHTDRKMRAVASGLITDPDTVMVVRNIEKLLEHARVSLADPEVRRRVAELSAREGGPMIRPEKMLEEIAEFPTYGLTDRHGMRALAAIRAPGSVRSVLSHLVDWVRRLLNLRPGTVLEQLFAETISLARQPDVPYEFWDQLPDLAYARANRVSKVVLDEVSPDGTGATINDTDGRWLGYVDIDRDLGAATVTVAPTSVRARLPDPGKPVIVIEDPSIDWASVTLEDLAPRVRKELNQVARRPIRFADATDDPDTPRKKRVDWDLSDYQEGEEIPRYDYPELSDIEELAEEKGIDVDDATFLDATERLTGKRHLDELDPAENLKVWEAIANDELIVDDTSLRWVVAEAASEVVGRGVESGTMAATVDKRQIVALLSASMYKNSFVEVCVKELLQNSFDAVKGRDPGRSDKPSIRIEIDTPGRTVKITDNGRGMSRETVRDAYLRIGGSDKAGLDVADRSGSLGIAKIAYLFGASETTISTVRDGRRTYGSMTPDDLIDDHVMMTTEPTSAPNGTTVTLRIPESYVDPQTGKETGISFPYGKPYPLSRPLLGDVEVTYVRTTRYGTVTDEVLPIGVNQALPPEFLNASADWGDLKVYLDETGGGGTLKVMSAGLYQFDFWVPKAKFNGIIDVRPKVTPEHPHYPFNNSREDFRPTIKKDIGALKRILENHRDALEAEKTARTFAAFTPLDRIEFDSLKNKEYEGLSQGLAVRVREEDVPGVGLPEEATKAVRKVTISDGKVSYKSGPRTDAGKGVGHADRTIKFDRDQKTLDDFKDKKKRDPSKPIYHNNTDFDPYKVAESMGYSREEVSVFLAKYASTVTGALERIVKAVPGFDDMLSGDEPYMTGLSIDIGENTQWDKGYRGVHAKVPFRAFFLNPMSAPFGRSARQMAHSSELVVAHEIAHHRHMQHNEEFVGALHKVQDHVMGTELGDDIINAFTSVIEDHFDLLEDLQREYNTPGRYKNLGEDRVDGSRLPDAGGDASDPTEASSEGRAPEAGGRPGGRGEDQAVGVIISRILRDRLGELVREVQEYERTGTRRLADPVSSHLDRVVAEMPNKVQRGGLLNFLKKKGVKDEELVDLDLAFKSDKGKLTLNPDVPGKKSVSREDLEQWVKDHRVVVHEIALRDLGPFEPREYTADDAESYEALAREDLYVNNYHSSELEGYTDGVNIAFDGGGVRFVVLYEDTPEGGFLLVKSSSPIGLGSFDPELLSGLKGDGEGPYAVYDWNARRYPPDISWFEDYSEAKAHADRMGYGDHQSVIPFRDFLSAYSDYGTFSNPAQIPLESMGLKTFEQAVERFSEAAIRKQAKELHRRDQEYALREHQSSGARWGWYTSPGGENYREHVYTAEGNPYSHMHWEGIDGVWAHDRVDDVTDAEGRRYMRVMEIQSDLHQGGRDRGYKRGSWIVTDEDGFPVDELGQFETPDEAQAAADSRPGEGLEIRRAVVVPHALQSGVPDTPFKRSWEDQVLKRLVRLAAEEGYDGILIESGEQVLRNLQMVDAGTSSEDLIGSDMPKAEFFRLMEEKYGDAWRAMVGKDEVDDLMLEALNAEDFKALKQRLGIYKAYDTRLPNKLSAIVKKDKARVVRAGQEGAAEVPLSEPVGGYEAVPLADVGIVNMPDLTDEVLDAAIERHVELLGFDYRVLPEGYSISRGEGGSMGHGYIIRRPDGSLATEDVPPNPDGTPNDPYVLTEQSEARATLLAHELAGNVEQYFTDYNVAHELVSLRGYGVDASMRLHLARLHQKHPDFIGRLAMVLDRETFEKTPYEQPFRRPVPYTTLLLNDELRTHALERGFTLYSGAEDPEGPTAAIRIFEDATNMEIGDVERTVRAVIYGFSGKQNSLYDVIHELSHWIFEDDTPALREALSKFMKPGEEYYIDADGAVQFTVKGHERATDLLFTYLLSERAPPSLRRSFALMKGKLEDLWSRVRNGIDGVNYTRDMRTVLDDVLGTRAINRKLAVTLNFTEAQGIKYPQIDLGDTSPAEAVMEERVRKRSQQQARSMKGLTRDEARYELGIAAGDTHVDPVLVTARAIESVIRRKAVRLIPQDVVYLTARTMVSRKDARRIKGDVHTQMLPIWHLLVEDPEVTDPSGWRNWTVENRTWVDPLTKEESIIEEIVIPEANVTAMESELKILLVELGQNPVVAQRLPLHLLMEGALSSGRIHIQDWMAISDAVIDTKAGVVSRRRGPEDIVQPTAMYGAWKWFIHMNGKGGALALPKIQEITDPIVNNFSAFPPLMDRGGSKVDPVVQGIVEKAIRRIRQVPDRVLRSILLMGDGNPSIGFSQIMEGLMRSLKEPGPVSEYEAMKTWRQDMLTGPVRSTEIYLKWDRMVNWFTYGHGLTKEERVALSKFRSVVLDRMKQRYGDIVTQVGYRDVEAGDAVRPATTFDAELRKPLSSEDIDAAETILGELEDASDESIKGLDWESRLLVARYEVHNNMLKYSEVDKEFLGAAIREFNIGFDYRIAAMDQASLTIGKMLAGTPGKGEAVAKELAGLLKTDADRQKLLNLFYGGRWSELIVWLDKFGIQTGYSAKTPRGMNMKLGLTNAVIRLMANDVVQGMLDELTAHGLGLSLDEVTSNLSFGTDRNGYLSSVQHHMRQIASLNNLIVRRDVEVPVEGEDEPEVKSIIVKTPDPDVRKVQAESGRWVSKSTGGSTAGTRSEDLPVLKIYHSLSDDPDDPEVPKLDLHNVGARLKAVEIMAGFGLQSKEFEFNVWETPSGQQVLMPDVVVRAIDDAMEMAASTGGAAGKLQFDPTILTDPLLEGYDPKWTVKGKIMALDLAETLGHYNPLTMGRIRMGITTGLGVPNVPYYLGVAIGGPLQVYTRLGLEGMLVYQNPRLALSVASNLSLRRVPSTKHLRMPPGADYMPPKPKIANVEPVVDPYGRVYTEAVILDLAQRHGLHSSFAHVQSPQKLSEALTRALGGHSFARKLGDDWQQILLDTATYIDDYFRVAVFIQELRKGRAPDAAADIARQTMYDYSSLSDFEAKILRRTLMFYSYTSKNAALTWWALLNHPSRIANQIRLGRDIHNLIYDDDERELVDKDYSFTRLPVGWRSAFEVSGLQSDLDPFPYKTVKWVMPMRPVEDALMIPADVIDALEGMIGGARSEKDAGRLVSRMTPYIQALYVATANKSPFYGGDLRPQEVPAWLIEWDNAVTGGVLRDWLGVTERVRKEGQWWDEPVNGFHQVSYVATNTKAWWFLTNVLQTPGFGRSMGLFDAVDKTNLGLMEVPVGLMYEANQKWPILPGRDQPFFSSSEDTALGDWPEMAGPRPYVGPAGEAFKVLGFYPHLVLHETAGLELAQEDLRRQTEAIMREELIE